MTFLDLLRYFLGALAVIGCWRGLAALVRREAKSKSGRLRYWWPTLMLAWSWFMLWETSFPSASAWLDFAKDPLLIAFFGVNLPGAVLGNGLLGVLIAWPDWAKASVASAAVWGVWWAIVVVWVRRSGAGVSDRGVFYRS
jgi:hypothetical protein